MGKKKRVLIAYPAMMVGGSTTSLLSILNMIDYSKYEIDLLLNSHTGRLMDKIPKQVNLLPPALKYTDRKSEYLHRIFSPRYMFHYAISRYISKRGGVAIHGPQYLEMKDVEFFKEIPGEYDVAIAFLEGDRCKFVARHIKAKRKLAWIHVNYLDGQFEPKYDRDSMKEFDRVVLVSEDCKMAYDQVFPELAHKSVVIENILSAEFVRKMAEEPGELVVDSDKLNLVTACRINFKSKGLDRAIEAMAKLKQEGKLSNVVWYILGDGPDYDTLKDMVKECSLEENVILLGMKINPYKYLKGMSMFFLPSRWEGKPMAITEAFMMGLPVLVTEYSSAREQVRDGIDGIIVDNSLDGIYKGLKRVIDTEEIIESLKKNVLLKEYSNIEEIKRIESIIDGEI